MRIDTLIHGIETLSVQGKNDRDVANVAFNSAEVQEGGLFVAIKGYVSDGHTYIADAIQKGAHVIVCQELPGELKENVTWIKVADSRHALSIIACNWYGNPSREIKLVGVTGTNGKTTIATLLYKVNTGLGYRAGILSTIEVIINGEKFPATHTTPDPLQINMWLRKMVDASCEYCFMEVSSHAVKQQRIAGLVFTGGIFTNITHDHLDYHADFRDYLEAKQAFFTMLPKNAFGLVNGDDRNGMIMLERTAAKKYRYSLQSLADFQGKVTELLFEGMLLDINDKEVWVKVTGRFNASNILAVYGTSVLLGHKAEEILEQISLVDPAEGRFDIVSSKSGAIAVVDYAHTDDALKNVLETIHEVNAGGKEIVTVVGAGGDRDKSKRKKMGNVAAAFSDKVILTSDNPRGENPDDIMREMEAGIDPQNINKILKIQDREEAIKTACMLAGENAIVLVAGKGHEKYQEINGRRIHFDDKEVIKKYLN